MYLTFSLLNRIQTARTCRAALCATLCTLFALLPVAALGKTVYENQPLVTDKELVAFMDLLPHFRAWAASSRDEAHPSITGGKPDFHFSPKAAEWVKLRGWDPARFFCVMGRAAAALSIVAEGNDVNAPRPPDMPAVTPQELALVRRHLAALLKAGNDAPPIKR